MKTKFLFLAVGVAFIASCSKDRGKVTLTYNKGTAIYADLDQIRSSNIVENSRTSIEDPGKIFIGEDFVLIGEENEGIHVFNNTNPHNPTPVSFINLPYSKEFYVDGNHIYAEAHYDMVKIDISDIHNPKLVDREENAFGQPILDNNGNVLVGFEFEVVTQTFKLNSNEARELNEHDYLFYDFEAQLIPYSTVPSSFVGNSNDTRGTINRIAVTADHVYVLGKHELHVFSDGSELNKVTTKNIWSETETIYAEGDYLFIGCPSSMIVMDNRNPENPETESEYWHPTSCDPVLPHGDVAFLTLRTGDFSGCSGDQNSLDVVDISNISNPTSIKSIDMHSPYGMSMIGNYLFVGEGTNGLAVFDASNPKNPQKYDQYDNIHAYDIMLHPTIPNLILTTGEGGLSQYQIDMSNMNISNISHINY